MGSYLSVEHLEEQSDSEKLGLLFHSLGCRNVSLVDQLISCGGIDINSINSDGDTPLHIAVSNVDVKMIRTLLASNLVQLNSKDSKGRTPLFLAVSLKQLEVITILLSKGASTDVQDLVGNCPL